MISVIASRLPNVLDWSGSWICIFHCWSNGIRYSGSSLKEEWFWLETYQLFLLNRSSCGIHWLFILLQKLEWFVNKRTSRKKHHELGQFDLNDCFTNSEIMYSTMAYLSKHELDEIFNVLVLIPFAIKYAGHVLTTTVRALEIVMVTMVELFIFGVFPIWTSWIGSGLVFFSVVGIAFCDTILAFLKTKWNKQASLA